MGGPLWTAPEEDYFWTKVVPSSDKKIGYDPKTQRGQVKSWETLANEMLAAMTAERAETGEKPLREYTALTLAEHWDKNVMQNRISKHAQDHVAAYLAELEEENGARWAKRQRRLGKGLPQPDDENDEARPKSKKRKLSPGAGTTTKTPATGGAAEDEEEQEVHDPQAALEGPSTERPSAELRSARHLVPGAHSRVVSRDYNTARRPFPSGPSGNTPSGAPGGNHSPGVFGQRANPNNPTPSFVDRSDNPYYPPPRQAPPPTPVTRRDMQTIVRKAVEARLMEIGDLVRGDINLLVEVEVRRQMDTVSALVRDEVARQLSSFRAPPAMAGGRSDIERRAAANVQRDLEHTARQALSAAGRHTPSTAYAPQQQQPYSSAGRGGPYSSRLPPAGQVGHAPPGGEAGSTTGRTPLQGQFPMSYDRSRVRGGRGGGHYVDDDEDEEEEEHRRA